MSVFRDLVQRGWFFILVIRARKQILRMAAEQTHFTDNTPFASPAVAGGAIPPYGIPEPSTTWMVFYFGDSRVEANPANGRSLYSCL
jgi:hypothetical protein